MSDPDRTAFEMASIAQAKALKKRKTRKRAQTSSTRPLPQFSPTQHKGFQAEDRASDYLTDQGLLILGKNLRCRSGEIDLVANDGGTLVFIEVRYRHRADFGGAAASVNRDKQKKLVRCARFFLPLLTRTCFNAITPPCRFDIVAIAPAGTTWIPHAFLA